MNGDLDRRLDTLPREIAPDPALEDRMVGSLRARGLLRSTAPARGALLAIAATLFITGLAAGYFIPRSRPPVVRPAPAFALLLYGDAAPSSGETDRQIVEEYRQWALSLAGEGRYVTGERLEGASELVGTGAGTIAPVRGFFIVSAPTFEEALSVARRCPHVRRGGQVVVRPIASS